MTQLPTLDTPASLTARGVRASVYFSSAGELGGSPYLSSDALFTLALRHHAETVSGFVWHYVIRAHLKAVNRKPHGIPPGLKCHVWKRESLEP